jgi:hypothetical protein
LAEAYAGNIKDNRGRPIAGRNEKGIPVVWFYPPEKHPQRKGESNYDYALRIEPPQIKGESDEAYASRIASLAYIDT